MITLTDASASSWMAFARCPRLSRWMGTFWIAGDRVLPTVFTGVYWCLLTAPAGSLCYFYPFILTHWLQTAISNIQFSLKIQL